MKVSALHKGENVVSIVLGLVVVAVLVLVAARYGADSRTGADPTGRDAAWPDRPVRHHTPRGDLRVLRALGRAWAAQVHAHRVLDRELRPWEACARPVTPRW